MAIPGSGPIKISEIATEFGDTTPNSMSEYYRGGSLVPDSPTNSGVPASGAIALEDFYGAQNRVALALTISSSTQNYDVFTQANASPSYSAGSSDITLTVNPGVVVGSSSTGTYALQVPSGFTSGDTVTVVNGGTVIGRGGNGGSGGPGYPSGNAGAGGSAGNALYVAFPTVVTNNGTLAGGGGGGGGGGGRINPPSGPPKNPVQGNSFGGGGGGGGAGNTAGSGAGGGVRNPGLPGSPGGSGSGGSTTGGGAGGSSTGGNGGAGGGQGANGSSGVSDTRPGAAGGTRGSYLVGNPLVTFPATGTRLGSVS